MGLRRISIRQVSQIAQSKNTAAFLNDLLRVECAADSRFKQLPRVCGVGFGVGAGAGKALEGFVKNRYIGRTFIMPGQSIRRKSVRQKLNAIHQEFRGKKVLLVDDSIVRGTTSREIVQMARDGGATQVYMASAAPPVRFANVYGIDMPTRHELIASNRTEDEICAEIGADALIYQDLEDLKAAVRALNPVISVFETSCFDGCYVTGDVTAEYLDGVETQRSEAPSDASEGAAQMDLNLVTGHEG